MVLGCPYHFGQDHKGVAGAPAVLRELGFLNQLQKFAPVKDLGDVELTELKSSLLHAKIKRAEANSRACDLVSQTIEGLDLAHHFLLNLGGDHGMSLGSIHGILSHRSDTIVIWVDAHGDINLPDTSPSGNFHGMPLAFLLELARDEKLFGWLKHQLHSQKLIFMGPRDLDPAEKKIIDELSIQYFSSQEINQSGASSLLKKALQKLDPKGLYPLHLSFDVDVFDAQDIQSTGTRVGMGPFAEEIFRLGKEIALTGRLRSMDLVELNPELGTEKEVLYSFCLAQQFILNTLKHLTRQEDYFPYLKDQCQYRSDARDPIDHSHFGPSI